MKICSLLFALIISMNQAYALSCELVCEFNKEIEQAHACCPKSDTQGSEDSKEGCAGHEFFGKCFHEEISFNLEAKSEKDLKQFNLSSYFSIVPFIFYTSNYNKIHPDGYQKTYPKKSLQKTYLIQEKFLI